MDIIIVGAAMPFGPDSLKFRSLGGSETAQLMMGKALAKLGHRVLQVTNLPEPGSPDQIEPGTLAEDGVRYTTMDNWETVVSTTPHDLLVLSRDLRMAGVPHQAKKCVFWAHDLATHSFMVPAIHQLAWNIDEIWAVSEWHAKQIAEVSGFPREAIRATHNAIVDVNDDTVVVPSFAPTVRDPKTLIYAARPERGLEALIREGGIMERLPDYKLKVSMYAHFPEHMRPLYDWCQRRIAALPNVEFMGSLTQAQMRSEIGAATAYVYPTMFEETSCILARECIEQKTPFLTTKTGALPETLGACGLFVENGPDDLSNVDWNSDEFCEAFATMVKRLFETDEGAERIEQIKTNMQERTDLYWDGVAHQWTTGDFAPDLGATKPFSVAWSLVRDGNVIPAIAYLRYLREYARTYDHFPEALSTLLHQLEDDYSFIHSDELLAEHYAEMHRLLARDDPKFQHDQVDAVVHSNRWQAVKHQLAQLPAGSRVMDFGCAEGVQVLAWAKEFPNLKFQGFDFAEMAIENARKIRAAHDIENVEFYYMDEIGPKDLIDLGDELYDAVICTEVLEHQPKPWELLQEVESYCKLGGKVILTTPYGEWETDQWEQRGRSWNRQHIWQIDGRVYGDLVGDKPNVDTRLIPMNMMPDGRARGHFVVTYDADHGDIAPISPLKVALDHNPRQTVTACLIACNSQATIRKTLDSLIGSVQAVTVWIDAKTKDRTREIVEEFAQDYSWIEVVILDRHDNSIEAGKFGFDDARNASIRGLYTDWFLWIDTDEFLTQPIQKYARHNAVDSYALHQHHFTTEPRGVPAQIDRPARLCRTGMQFYGKVHEHAEKGFNTGPGFSILIGDSDIGHIGYEDERIRRKRFERNYPFLEWDTKVNPERKLGPYLWFRDILHRMRYAMEARNGALVRDLANEAIEYFNNNTEAIIGFGQGIQNAMAYLGEAYKVLGRGREVQVQIMLDGSPLAFGGQIEHSKQLTRIIDHMLDPELAKARGRYWR